MTTAAARSRECVSETSRSTPRSSAARSAEPREAKGRSRVLAALDLDLVQAQAAEAERLERRLLGGEARGEVPGGMRARRCAASSSRSVKIRPASAGRRSSARSIRSISIRSMPAPRGHSARLQDVALDRSVVLVADAECDDAELAGEETAR